MEGRLSGSRTGPSAHLAIALAALLAAPAAAQSAWSLDAGAGVIPLLTHATPAMAGEDRTELYLTQPVLMAHARPPGGRLALSVMLNLEGLTLQRGELNAGVWGEGYVDRRHPHTYLHEVVGSAWLAGREGAPRALTLTVGRGFAPFGTDDPMARPMVKFPANHHLSHLLERWVAVAALRAGRVVVEAGVFNGNEPAGVSDLRGVDRFGDSRAARLTLLPLAGVELQASHARVDSPELPPGSGSEHRKWSASARLERADARGGRLYALVEWARTAEYFGEEPAETYPTLLAEAAARRRGVEVAARWERTTRPEEERLDDPFRSAHPHTDVHLVGITRWDILSARAEVAVVERGVARARPFLELSRAAVRKVLPTQLHDPVEHYGDDRIWTLSLGVRLQAGMAHPRMGRYGAALPTPAGAAGHHETHGAGRE